MGSYGSQSGSSGSYGGPTQAQRQYQSNYLQPFFQQQGTQESPYSAGIQSMYQNLISNPSNYQLSPQAGATINEMVTTGAPYSQTDIYKAARPEYERNLEQAIAQAKESSGAMGGLRSTGGFEAMGTAAAGATEDFSKYLQEMASQSYEAAQNRRMGAIPQAFQQAGFGTQELGNLQGLAQAISQGQYPFLNQAMTFGGAGTPLNIGSSTSSGSNYGLCTCEIFTEGWTRKLEASVRRYRDAHFSPFSFVSKGYKLTSKLIVPPMLVSKIFRQAIRTILHKPLSRVARNWEGSDNRGWMFKPLAWFWVGMWDMLGRVHSLYESKFTLLGVE
jgi:hypothetical protein